MIRYILFSVVLMFGCSTSEHGCPQKTCNDYATQQEAQTAYDADKTCLKNLDNNSDGVACENLSSGSGSGCNGTANCGCSNKTKNQCASTCCKWIVGTGCVCK